MMAPSTLVWGGTVGQQELGVIADQFEALQGSDHQGHRQGFCIDLRAHIIHQVQYHLGSAGNESADALRQALIEKLPAWQVPRDWRLVSSLAPGVRGKLSRSEWRQRYLDQSGP